jgi:hypothetical protein
MENAEEQVFEKSSFLSNVQYDKLEHRGSERCECQIHPSGLAQYVIGGLISDRDGANDPSFRHVKVGIGLELDVNS